MHDIKPARRVPYVTYLVIALNLAMFVYQFLTLTPQENQLFVHRHGVVPLFLLSGYGPAVSTLFSSLFLHGGILHLGLNMLFLHIFGDIVEDTMGHVRFALFYLFSGVASALAHALLDPDSQLPLLGASGAISGVLGAYLTMFPRGRVKTWLFALFELPAFVFVVIWFGTVLLSALGTQRGWQATNVIFFAHLAGFVAGVLWLLVLGKPRLPPRTYLGPQLPTRAWGRR